MSHTFSPEASRLNDMLASVLTLAAALVAVVVVFPAEGHVLVPVHDFLYGLFGQTTFLLPLGLGLAAGLAFVRRARPALPFPRRRLAGLAVIAMALLPAEHLLGQSTGLVGEWFTGFLIELLGGPITVALTLVLMTGGSILAFDLRHWRRPLATR